MLLITACAGKTTGATNVTDGSATLTATARCDSGETCTWYWEYWAASQSRSSSTKTPVQGPVSGPTGDVSISTKVSGLGPDTAYEWVLCGSPNDGGSYGCVGPNGTVGAASATPPPDYATFTSAPVATLTAAWDGASWAIQSTPTPPNTKASLLGASCTSATACTTVGYYDTTVGTVLPLAERWDGTSWAVQAMPSPTGAGYSQPTGVSCVSQTTCTAVGYFTDSAGVDMTLAEHWNGTSWSIQPTPNPTGARRSQLLGVSCVSANACTAVGYYVNSAGVDMTLAEHWNGTSWKIQSTPNPTGATGSLLRDVSCTSKSACFADWYYTTSTGSAALVERWNGSHWTIQPVPTPAGATGSALRGMACTSSTACTAVGYYDDSAGTQLTLAEAWDGTNWTVQTTPNVTGAHSGILKAVSCLSATLCTAVGGYVDSTGADHILAEGLNGTSWTIQPTPSTTGVLPTLSAVSCASSSACVADGQQ